MDELNVWLIGGGLAVGAVFAILIQRFQFCLVAAIRNLLLKQDHRQTLAFSAALLVAITGTQLLEIMGIVAIADSPYRNSTLDWFGAAAGGIIFGVGATLAGGCAARTLVRSMEGSIHSLIALLAFMIVAAVAQFGFLEQTRLDITYSTSIELNSDAGIASMLSLPAWLVLTVVILSLLFLIYKNWGHSPDKTMLVAGLIIGGLVIGSWYITGVLAQDEFDPKNPSSITMSGPMARFGYILISGRIAELSFAISFVIAIAVVSLLLAVATRQFKITLPEKGMIKFAVVGGSLMGIGGIMAYGCNVGQGLSGISTLSLESLLAVIGMMLGISVMSKLVDQT